MTGPPTQHQDLPQIESPASASALAVRLTRLTQAVAETQDRALGLALDLGAIHAELVTLTGGCVELAMAEPGPAVASALADGDESASDHRGPSGPRPRPVHALELPRPGTWGDYRRRARTTVGQEPWLFAAVVL